MKEKERYTVKEIDRERKVEKRREKERELQVSQGLIQGKAKSRNKLNETRVILKA